MEKMRGGACWFRPSPPLSFSLSLRPFPPSLPLFPLHTRLVRSEILPHTQQGLNGVSFLYQMALSDSKVLFWNGKIPSKSIHFDVVTDKDHTEQPAPAPTAVPTLCGMPLKYISYVFPFFLPPDPISCWLRPHRSGQTYHQF